MKRIMTFGVVLVALLIGGCATKKFVRESNDPVRAKLDKVADQTDKQGATLDQHGKELAEHDTEISRADEKATTAGSRAGDALNRANQAGQKSDQNARDLGELRRVVANLDDYKAAGQATAHFGFNRDTLSKEAKEELDKIAAGKSSLKWYFVTVEGFTDSTGDADYNVGLSRRRADRVVQYLAVQHNIPVYRIHTLGLGANRPADAGNTREARAKNRRVEVAVYTADVGAAASK